MKHEACRNLIWTCRLLKSRKTCAKDYNKGRKEFKEFDQCVKQFSRFKRILLIGDAPKAQKKASWKKA